MIQDFVVRKQTPDNANNWLYSKDGYERIFSKEVYLPNGAQPWAECTNAEKISWEESHPQPEPEVDE